GSASKPTLKSAPPKTGYSSLCKTVTPRRAPANLPSIKSENCGNDPAINLVPSGGSGWASGNNASGPGGSGASTAASSNALLDKNSLSASSANHIASASGNASSSSSSSASHQHSEHKSSEEQHHPNGSSAITSA
ncbi:Protein PRRC2Clike, partial [Caligus rogercresseyi]